MQEQSITVEGKTLTGCLTEQGNVFVSTKDLIKAGFTERPPEPKGKIKSVGSATICGVKGYIFQFSEFPPLPGKKHEKESESRLWDALRIAYGSQIEKIGKEMLMQDIAAIVAARLYLNSELANSLKKALDEMNRR